MKYAYVLSPLEGEMAAKQPEGDRTGVWGARLAPRAAATTPPPAFDRTLPASGRE